MTLWKSLKREFQIWLKTLFEVIVLKCLHVLCLCRCATTRTARRPTNTSPWCCVPSVTPRSTPIPPDISALMSSKKVRSHPIGNIARRHSGWWFSDVLFVYRRGRSTNSLRGWGFQGQQKGNFHTKRYFHTDKQRKKSPSSVLVHENENKYFNWGRFDRAAVCGCRGHPDAEYLHAFLTWDVITVRWGEWRWPGGWGRRWGRNNGGWSLSSWKRCVDKHGTRGRKHRHSDHVSFVPPPPHTHKNVTFSPVGHAWLPNWLRPVLNCNANNQGGNVHISNPIVLILVLGDSWGIDLTLWS